MRGWREFLARFIWAAFILFTGAGRATAGVVPDALHEKASSEGSVRVIVQLRVDTVPEGHLESANAVASQRQGIAARRSELMIELAVARHRMIREFETIPFVALEVGSDAVSVLKESPNVLGVEEDRLDRPLLSQSVPLVGATQAWAAGFDGTGMVVAILDTGVDKNHPFLAGKVVEEACFTSNNSCPNGIDSQIGSGAAIPCTYAPGGCRHGTFVAGIAAGAGASLSGVAKGAQIMAVQVFSRVTGTPCNSAGEDPCALSSEIDQIAGLDRVFALRNQHTFAAVNLSLGGGKFTSPCDNQQAAREAAIDNLRSVGIATIAASGNDGFSDGIGAPACISTAVSVGATTKADTVWSDSNSASFLSLLAPGVSITSSVPGGGFLSGGQGTSFAAPHVTGAWAILKQKKPSVTVTEILNALTSTGLPITDPKNGITKPRIRVNEALQTLTVSMTEVHQVLNGRTRRGAGGSPQRTFLTTDPITFEATYLDPTPTCIGVAPTFVQLFMFNTDGLFILQVNANSTPISAGSKFRTLSMNLPAGTLGAGSYKFTFLVRDCANTKSVVLPQLLTFDVNAP